MNHIIIRATILLAALSISSPAQAQTYSVLHSFGGSGDGNTPYNRLTLIDSTLYGTTWGSGVVFKMGADGSGYQILHTVGSVLDSSLTPVGSTLYGMRSSGPTTIFKLGMDGSDYSVVHTFSSAEGWYAWGDLLLNDATLYGTCISGSTGNGGTLFKIGTNGIGMTVLHAFASGNGGIAPGNGLVLGGSTLFGMTSGSGENGHGTLFQINTGGTGYSILHSFAGGNTDGATPYGSLTLSGSTLYGVTQQGGASNLGTIFSVQTDGSDFTLVHTFDGTDGSRPWAERLVLDGSTLYGTTSSGGAYDKGTVFQMQTDGSDFRTLHSFSGTDGADCEGGLVLDGSTLYGVAAQGGTWNKGVAFSLLLPRDVCWTGETGSTWSTATGSGNWKLSGSGETGEYAENSNVTFDDSATGSLSVNISSTDVSPASVTFNNSSKDFVVTGSKGIVGSATVLKQGTAKVTLSSVNSYSGVTTIEGGTLQFNGAAARNPVLSLGGANIKAGTMVFDYAGEGTPAATIDALLATSYHSGSATHFDTGQFQSSSADAHHGLGWIETMDQQVVVALTLYGDATVDGGVDISDLSALGQNWNGSGKYWSQGDFNYDGKVDISDLSALGQHWNQSVAAFSGGDSGATVPEPAAIILLATGGMLLGGLGVARRRRRAGFADDARATTSPHGGA